MNTDQGTVTLVDACRVCGERDWLDVISFGPVELANGFLDADGPYPPEPTYPLDVVACRNCWLMCLRHVVDPEVLFADYVYVSQASAGLTRHMGNIVDWCTAKAGLSPGDLVVELGSNIGAQLALFAERGLRVVGIDPARNLAKVANDNGIETIADFFGPAVSGPIAREKGKASLVLGRQCFAHINDVHNVLNGVQAVLRDDGVLVIEVPYLVDLLQDNQFDTIFHEHLSYYSLGTLSVLFRYHGLRIIDVQRANVHGGSIVVFASRPADGREPEPAVADLLAAEERLGLRSERAYLEFAGRTRRLTGQVRQLVRDLVADGKRVAGYGAPSKGCTLLQLCGLGTADLEFCSDTTPGKQGKVLPGTHIPVWSPERARQSPPDCYLLLAWNYAEDIIRNEQAFLDQGGQFIVPIPEPRVVGARQAAVAS
ncbi:MAG TPA: class I SAM-dependent methyltransferase [Streptosporangiaceae bacterium]|nr:class I SAM-dependent methyltransferase [Streptosporangiaceae bacterium]